ncbi:hypothetical protein PsorP6_012657 [Peronosclerospora sorghi]|uniref:Uncharacterized protein n=1 Tax=Peronosclerospora sorghi TaxID=230839 RepID=A0ACC0WH85_9STRA|nr:hypothetical protein PsorP6_012657 [Peronosclerospora sorghi]
MVGSMPRAFGVIPFEETVPGQRKRYSCVCEGCLIKASASTSREVKIWRNLHHPGRHQVIR